MAIGSISNPGTKLADLPIGDLKKLVSEVKAGFETRDTLWQARRKVRYRQMDQELLSLPLSNRAGSNQALMIMQTEEPNQEVHRRVKRLISNPIRVQTVIYDSNDDQRQLAQEIQDALSALYKWMNRGKVPAERRVVEHQQADGLGIFKLDFIPTYADDSLSYFDLEAVEIPDEEAPADEAPEQRAARHSYQKIKASLSVMTLDDGSPKYLPGADLEATAYKQATDQARRKCDPPFRLSSVDPVSAFWTMDGDQIDLVIEDGKRPLSALLDSLKSRGVRLIENRLVVFPENTDAAGDATIPDNETPSKGTANFCDYTEIRTRKEIVLMIKHPKLVEQSGSGSSSGSRTEDDTIIIGYDNPFGPYSTGYVLVPGDVTGSHDPADEYQPSILGTLSVAQPLNVLRTVRLSAAIDKALASKYVKVADAQPAPQLSQARSDKTPSVKNGKPVPQIPGEVKREDSPNVDLEKSVAELMEVEAQNRFNETLSGDASSGDSGHKLAIQVSQADTQLVPYQNARAEATVEIMMCCLYAAKKLDQTIYVKELPDRRLVMLGKADLQQPVRAITPEMFDLDFNLIVMIGSETPVTKFAKWAALEQRFKAGNLSLETLMEESDVENPEDELARIFEGQTLVALMQDAIPVVVEMLKSEVLAALQGQQPQGSGAPGQQPPPEQGGNENGGGAPGAAASTPIAQVGRVPGVGMSPAGPTTGEYGPRVNEGGGGGQPGTGVS